MRDSSPPDAVSATGPNGSPAFGRTAKTASSAPEGAWFGLAQVDVELTLAEPDARELGRDRLGKAGRGRSARLA